MAQWGAKYLQVPGQPFHLANDASGNGKVEGAEILIELKEWSLFDTQFSLHCVKRASFTFQVVRAGLAHPRQKTGILGEQIIFQIVLKGLKRPRCL